MSTYETGGAGSVEGANRVPARRSTETKASTKTTELIVYIGAVIGVVVTALVVGSHHIAGTNRSSADPFNAQDAIRYITYLTIGYMVARGLAKSGSRDYYDA